MEHLNFYVAMYLWSNFGLSLFVRIAFREYEFPRVLNVIIIIVLPLTLLIEFILYLTKKGQGALTMINNIKKSTRKFVSTQIDRGAIRLINIIDKLRGDIDYGEEK